ncbi:MAG: MFS transporter [Deltaproteobacteria bacterium]|nr:MFS transporter [Deltaproteobacteria bacterium]
MHRKSSGRKNRPPQCMGEDTTRPSATPQARDRLREVLPPVLFLTLIFFLHFLGRQLLGPMLPAMERDLRISHAVSGLFILVMGAGFFLSQLVAAFVTARFGYRICIVLSLWGAAASMAGVGLVGSLWALFLGFFLLGVTGGLYAPSGIALISVLVHPRDWGKAMGIHELAPNLALIVAPFFATMVLGVASWRWGFLSLSGFLAVTGAVYARHGVDAEARGSIPDIHRVREIAGNPAFWGLVGLLSIAVGVETGVYAVVPLFLVNERGFDLAEANRILGLSRIPGLAVVLLSGWITDRLSPRTTLRLALGATGVTIIVLGLGPRSVSIPSIFAQAAAAACLFPPILSAASGISTPENRALTISLSLAVAPVLGGGLVPAGIAFAGDLGSFGLGLAGAGVLVLFGVMLVRSLERGKANLFSPGIL